MEKTIMDLHIRSFPADLHRKAKAAAALKGIRYFDFHVNAVKAALEKEKPIDTV